MLATRPVAAINSVKLVMPKARSETFCSATYCGGKIKFGHILGLVDEKGKIEMRYHQVNSNGELMTGICTSVPEVLSNGKIRLHETWQNTLIIMRTMITLAAALN